jgi:hypothetical protein
LEGTHTGCHGFDWQAVPSVKARPAGERNKRLLFRETVSAPSRELPHSEQGIKKAAKKIQKKSGFRILPFA